MKRYQTYLNSHGAGLKVDGNFGPATTKAAAACPPPPEVPIPKMCAWVDRAWAFQGDNILAAARRANVSRLGLFLGSLDAGAEFKPFVSRDKLLAFIKEMEQNKLEVDLTTWIWPSRKFLDQMLDYVKPVLQKIEHARLDLDTEGAFASKKYSQADRTAVARVLYEQVDPSRVSINDYSGLQDTTRPLLHEKARRRPQNYSVGYVRAGGETITVIPGSIYYPGETQCHGMQGSLWGGVMVPGVPVEMGLAAYKPIKGWTIAQQIDTQVQASLWFAPSEDWFWSIRTEGAYLEAIQSWSLARNCPK